MNLRKKIFTHRNPYDIIQTSSWFVSAIKENIELHRSTCPDYDEILQHCSFDINNIQREQDLCLIPPIPTLYYKQHDLRSIPLDKIKVEAKSSGTSGKQSTIYFDRSSIYYGIRMMIRFFSFHKVISLLPTNYIILGYPPSKDNPMGAVKTAYGTTKFAPAKARTYALMKVKDSYEVNIEGITKALLSYAKQPFPVRLVGFPSYLYFLTKTLKEHHIALQLPKSSRVLLGGGWKQFADEAIDQTAFYDLIQETLGIGKEQCLEFFSVVEHPIPYCKCKNGQFHVPIYSRILIRDVKTLEPVEDGVVGILNMITPLVSSTPLCSVLSDDLATLHHQPCGCGLATPYFTLLGRSGLADIQTCAAGASEALGGKNI